MIDLNSWALENTYANLPKAFFSEQNPIAVKDPKMVCFNEDLATALGLDFLIPQQHTIANYFSGNQLFRGTSPLAQAYAGHQFGHFTMLGDGRAILLGEHIAPNGERFDLQLKGSGQTPYSRRGDGRATLYSMLREYLISEAMHHLGIPTSRSLAVVSTGEEVYREDIHMGGVLTRVAKSHIRVGTFEYARNMASEDDLSKLSDYTIKRHFPELMQKEHPALELFKELMSRQIDLVVNWMRVGFIHGVMNTDNMSIAGETIDYGPCAFMNSYNPTTVFSSIDTQGRYAFGNQPKMVHWNLTAFANAILPELSSNQNIAIDMAKEVLNSYQDLFHEKWYRMMFSKIGILHPKEEDKALVKELLHIMERRDADYTQTFIALQENKVSNTPYDQSEDFNNWMTKWEVARLRESSLEESRSLMRKTNPGVIPRNHWVENALQNAVQGNMNPFKELMQLLSTPYADCADEKVFEVVPDGFDEEYQTFCGT